MEKKKLYEYIFNKSIISGNLNLVKYLVEKINEINEDYIPKFINSLNLLGDAVEIDYYDILKYLVENIEGISKAKDEAFSYAFVLGKLDFAKYLYEHGADIRYGDYVFIDNAIQYGHLNLVRYAFEEIIPKIPNEKEYLLENAIKTAKRYNRKEILEYLEKI